MPEAKFGDGASRTPSMPLAAQEVRAAAQDCGFTLVGLAPATPLDPAPLVSWIEHGYCADLASMRKRVEERLNPAAVVPGAQTVIVLGIPYGPGEPSAPPRPAIARYARGRDYHYAHRDRMRALRGRLLTLDPTLRTYACVDAGAAMEKAWAERAGVGFIGKNGVVISRSHGSWFTLSLMVIDRPVDSYDQPHSRLCGNCDKCLAACPTQAFPSPGVVDARRCLSYHTVENRAEIPTELRAHLGQHVFGCDVCQEVCPFNQGNLPPGDPRQAARPLGHMTAIEMARLSQAEFDLLASGTPMRRIGYNGLRRSACLSLGATHERGAKALLEFLRNDASHLVAEAARWALQEMGDEG